MKIILYMTITANGFIATEEGDTSWVSGSDWENFRDFAKKTKVVIMGRGAYDAMIEAKTFPVQDTLNIVMTAIAPDVEPLKNVKFSDKSPEEIVEELAAEGFEEALLIGGGSLNASFLTDGLVDEIYLTVAPVIFSSGTQLSEHGDFRRNLDLLDIKKISESEIQLHYAVRKHTLDSYMDS